MANNIHVKCNFTTVFAKYDNIEDLKSIANNICAQVKEAYDARLAEIKSGNNGVVVEVIDAAPDAAPASKQSKAKESKTAAAKEAAAKMKKQAAAAKTSASASTLATNDDTLIAVTDTEAIKALGLTFEKYNDRCWVLRGNTKPLRKVLKEQFRGVFNSRLSGGEGWVFKTTSAQGVSDALGLKVKVS